jgi:mannose-6-phosphate isomerase-like protein (cupin superfamily)
MPRKLPAPAIPDTATGRLCWQLAVGALGLISALSGCTGVSPQPPSPSPSPPIDSAAPKTSTAAPSPSPAAAQGQSFDVASVGTDAGPPTTFTSLLDIPSMQVGVYHMQPGAAEPQTTQTHDDVYIVIEGSAVLHTADLDASASDGSVIFVRQGVAHDFEQVEGSLTVVVLSAKARGGSDEPPIITADATSLAASSSTEANLWRRFLEVPSITGGACFLPLKRDGDRSQTHETDELNVVISGTGVLQVGSKDQSYGPGSLIFVPARVGHAFHDLGSDSVVLISWPANPGTHPLSTTGAFQHNGGPDRHLCLAHAHIWPSSGRVQRYHQRGMDPKPTRRVRHPPPDPSLRSSRTVARGPWGV